MYKYLILCMNIWIYFCEYKRVCIYLCMYEYMSINFEFLIVCVCVYICKYLCLCMFLNWCMYV